MALSDEDYGILLNAVESQSLDYHGRFIIAFHQHIAGIADYHNKQQMLDTAAFIILSEGRELP